jgi:hypothetical protein
VNEDGWWKTLLSDVAAFEAAVCPMVSWRDPRDRWEGITVEPTAYGALVTATIRHHSLPTGKLRARYAIARGARFPGALQVPEQPIFFPDEDLLEELATAGWKVPSKHPELDRASGDVTFWMYNTWSEPWDGTDESFYSGS